MYDLLTIGKSGAFGQENGFYKKTLAVFRCFFYKIHFPGQTVHFCLWYVILILKAYGSAVNLSYLESTLRRVTFWHSAQ